MSPRSPDVKTATQPMFAKKANGKTMTIRSGVKAGQEAQQKHTVG